MSERVRAAGGVVWRPHGDDSGDGQPLVAVVHRPKYDDWSLPKGKADKGESFEDCALREVVEETGYTCRLGAPLGEVTYDDRFGRPKVVKYWAMEPIGGGFAPNNEVDELRWVSTDEATNLLSYDRDADVIGRFVASQERARR